LMARSSTLVSEAAAAMSLLEKSCTEAGNLQ
jgi:hypothetical protein